MDDQRQRRPAPTPRSTCKANPLADRPDTAQPVQLLDKYGDPVHAAATALPRRPARGAHHHVSPTVDTLHIGGTRFYTSRATSTTRRGPSRPAIMTRSTTASARSSPWSLNGGAGGPCRCAGRLPLRQRRREPHPARRLGHRPGAAGNVDDLQPLPGPPAPANPASTPAITGDRSGRGRAPGNPCPADGAGQGVHAQRRRRRLGHVQRRPHGLRAGRPGRGVEAGHLQARAARAARRRRRLRGRHAEERAGHRPRLVPRRGLLRTPSRAVSTPASPRSRTLPRAPAAPTASTPTRPSSAPP